MCQGSAQGQQGGDRNSANQLEPPGAGGGQGAGLSMRPRDDKAQGQAGKPLILKAGAPNPLCVNNPGLSQSQGTRPYQEKQPVHLCAQKFLFYQQITNVSTSQCWRVLANNFPTGDPGKLPCPSWDPAAHPAMVMPLTPQSPAFMAALLLPWET